MSSPAAFGHMNLNKDHTGMSIRLTRAFALAAVVTSLAGAAVAADSTDPVVATVNGKDIHLSTVKSLQQTIPQFRQAPLEANYDRILSHAITGALILDQAKKQKLEGDAQVKLAFIDAQNNILEQAWLSKKVDADITDAKVKARFDEIVKNWEPREEVKVAHILVDTEDAAKAVIADLKTGVSFEDEAKAKSKDGSKKNGGDIGYISKDASVVPEFADAAFKLKVGEITPAPVKTQFGWHVIKAEDRRMAPPPTYDEARGPIRNQLAQEDVQQVLDELVKSAQVKRFKADGSPADPMPAPAPTAAPKP
jgi:peptidyl-prolyl cis-trans isomerase C